MSTYDDTTFDIEERARLLDEWVATRREIASLEAQAADLLATRLTIHDADAAENPFHRESIYRSMVAEYSAAGRISTGSIEFAFSDARELATQLPSVRAAFSAGAISAAHVREIIRASTIVSIAISAGTVDPEVMDLYESAALVVAEADTPARTRAHARQVAAALTGETIIDRHRRATSERTVTVKSVDDGLALLTAVLPEWIAVAIADRLTRMAREIARARDDAEPVLGQREPMDDSGDAYDRFDDVIFGSDDTFTSDPLGGLKDPLTDPTSPDIEHIPSDTRTLDQIRADLLADLLLAGDPSDAAGTAIDKIEARIQVTVAASTLTGHDDRPAELDGHGPLDPDIARELAGRHTGWSRLFLDPKGQVVETDTYTPTEAMRRFLRARDQHCRFPGCRMPVHRSEIDHTHDHAKGGKTRIDNLAHLCVRHHSLKHPDVDDHYRWTAIQLPGGGITWVSPLGRSYTDQPRQRVMFV